MAQKLSKKTMQNRDEKYYYKCIANFLSLSFGIEMIKIMFITIRESLI